MQKFRNSSVMLEHPSFRPKVCVREYVGLHRVEFLIDYRRSSTLELDPWLAARIVSLVRTTHRRCAAALRMRNTSVCIYNQSTAAGFKKRLTSFHLVLVGLFAPRIGQQYRDEQRRRRSQFDRGTIAAERESCVGRNNNNNNNTRRSPGYMGAGNNNMMSPSPVSTRSWHGNSFAENSRRM